MKVLVVGGTQFVGRAIVETAYERGHDITLLHRGETEPSDLPAVEHLHADRLGDLSMLADREFDAVVDVCAYFPRHVTTLADALGDRVRHYTFISTISAYPDNLANGATETTSIRQPPFPDTESQAGENYGGLKAACESVVRQRFAERALIVRPGYVVGPYDVTDRYTSYVRRAALDDPLLMPGGPEDPMQLIDVRDLAEFTVLRVEFRDTETYVVVGVDTTFGEIANVTREAAGTRPKVDWVAPEDMGDDKSGEVTEFPLWSPNPSGLLRFDATKAVNAGLTRRPLLDTTADTLAWDVLRGCPPLKVSSPRRLRSS